MAVLRLKLNNILCFNNFDVDFSYPKKLVNTNLENEYLKGFPNIRYRKLNIIVGSNASGKTSLGKAIWKIFLFLHKKEANIITELVADNQKDSYILIDCVFPEGLFFRAEIKILINGEILVKYQELRLKADDTYESIVDKLNKDDDGFVGYVKGLEQAVMGGWNFKFPSIESGFDRIACSLDKEERNDFSYVLEKVLKTFDSSIKEVKPSVELDDSYIVTFKNHNKPISITNGERLSDIKTLSSGSKYAINIAGVIYAIKKHINGFYFVDEQFSYVDPDLEIACLTTMVSLLDDGEQLFFTSHDREILSLPFPNHSFNFLRKTIGENGQINIEMINAASLEKRNNVNIKNLYDNDFFNVAPETKFIFELGENK